MLHLLGSKSQRLLLYGREMEVFGHFVKENGGFNVVETKDDDGIDPKVK